MGPDSRAEGGWPGAPVALAYVGLQGDVWELGSTWQHSPWHPQPLLSFPIFYAKDPWSISLTLLPASPHSWVEMALWILVNHIRLGLSWELPTEADCS